MKYNPILCNCEITRVRNKMFRAIIFQQILCGCLEIQCTTATWTYGNHFAYSYEALGQDECYGKLESKVVKRRLGQS